MRVVSGSCKGMPLKAVPGKSTRPTTDKVKEAIFNMIGPYFDGGYALDLFGGSGGLGLEALSRGMEHCIFVDRDAKAIQTIKTNVEYCKFTDHVEIYRNDAERALKAITKRNLRFSKIFLDPPYKHQKIKNIIELIENNRLLYEGGHIVVEHSTDVKLPNTIGGVSQIKHEVYGITAITIYQYC
ncbi:16S rRNA (guanine(966)-N(2))-methyltransferase RsmD [Bacillus sp. SCS-151]|uniref:16S rRNA (guanine(966)-N(2))-methyltransferase RsmD n=1 Tax=Nanhaiella sioensis TaxID=3115293 RepID=UPI00397E571F